MRSHCGWYRKTGRRGCATERPSRLQELRQGRILRAGGQEAWPGECLAALSLEHLKHTPAFIAPLRSPFLSTKKPVCLSLVLPPEVSGPATPQHPSLPPSLSPVLPSWKNLCPDRPSHAPCWLLVDAKSMTSYLGFRRAAAMSFTSHPTNRKTYGYDLQIASGSEHFLPPRAAGKVQAHCPLAGLFRALQCYFTPPPSSFCSEHVWNNCPHQRTLTGL